MFETESDSEQRSAGRQHEERKARRSINLVCEVESHTDNSGFVNTRMLLKLRYKDNNTRFVREQSVCVRVFYKSTGTHNTNTQRTDTGRRLLV